MLWQIFNVFTTTFGTAYEKIITKEVQHEQLHTSAYLEEIYPVVDRVLSTYRKYLIFYYLSHDPYLKVGGSGTL